MFLRVPTYRRTIDLTSMISPISEEKHLALPSLILKTSSSTSTALPSTSTSSSRLIFASIIGTNSTQIISSTVSSSAVDDLPTTAASSTPVPEFTATTTYCDGLACETVAIGPSMTSTLCIAESNPTGSSDQPTTTKTSATETSSPTATSSVCTPRPTSCSSFTDNYFTLMAVSSDSSVNGKYAVINGDTIAKSADAYHAAVFCLDSNNNVHWSVTDGFAAVKSSNSGPIEFETQGNPLTCTAVPNEDCTATLSCTWYNDYRMVVDDSNTLYLIGYNTDYGGNGNPIPVTLSIQAWTD